jgi:tetratricopeptide (TPR) repeat protein
VFEVVATRLGQGLEQRPDKHPEETTVLDRYEQLIEALRLAGRVQEAFDLYWDGLGSAQHLAKKLGEYARAYRILRGFLPPSGDRKGFGVGLTARDRAVGLNELGAMARFLGRLHEAAEIRREHDALSRVLDDGRQTSIGLQNTCDAALHLGRLWEALAAAREALTEAERVEDDTERLDSISARGNVQHRLGDLAAARDDFTAATALESEPVLCSLRGQHHARHYLDLGDTAACRAIAEAGLPVAQYHAWNFEIPGWHALFARIAIEEGQSPLPHIGEIRAWTARTGDIQWILEAHDLAARAALIRGDLHGARAEADDGLRQARLCGFRLQQIELLATLSAIELAWPDADRALAAAREALDLATAPECQDAWGEADAAHAWGLAFEALGQREHAQRAFRQALAVRERIEHPQADATRAALARVSG